MIIDVIETILTEFAGKPIPDLTECFSIIYIYDRVKIPNMTEYLDLLPELTERILLYFRELFTDG